MATDFVTITDTGKRRTSSASAEETDIANSGSAITLQGVELTFGQETMLNDDPSVGRYTTSSDATTKWNHGEVDTLGVNKPTWKARGLIKFASANMAQIKHLRDLGRTKGYKTLSGDLPDWMDGNDNASTVSVHVKSVKIRHNSNNDIIEYDIDMVETE